MYPFCYDVVLKRRVYKSEKLMLASEMIGCSCLPSFVDNATLWAGYGTGKDCERPGVPYRHLVQRAARCLLRRSIQQRTECSAIKVLQKLLTSMDLVWIDNDHDVTPPSPRHHHDISEIVLSKGHYPNMSLMFGWWVVIIYPDITDITASSQKVENGWRWQNVISSIVVFDTSIV